MQSSLDSAGLLLFIIQHCIVSDRQRLTRMAELEGNRPPSRDPVEEEWSVEKVLDKRVSWLAA